MIISYYIAWVLKTNTCKPLIGDNARELNQLLNMWKILQ